MVKTGGSSKVITGKPFRSGYKPNFRDFAGAVGGLASQLAQNIVFNTNQMDWRKAGPGKIRTGKIAAKSAGFFKKGTKKFKKKKMVKVQKRNGINHTAENFGTLNGIDSVWIGHVTYPKDQIYRQAVKTIFTEFMKRSNYDVVSGETSYNSIPSGSIISIDFRTTGVGPASTNSFTFGTGVGQDGINMEAFVTWFCAIGRGWAGLREAVFWKMYWASASSNNAELLLNTFLVSMYVKSTLKLQNRSVDADGADSTDDVDTTPLVGKHYNASGTYLKLRKNNLANTGSAVFIGGDPFSGTVIANDADNSMKEPPQGRAEFSNCKSVGKAHLDPGEIKTSVLSSSFKMYFSTIHQLLSPDFASATVPSASGTGYRERLMGKLRVFCLEKMINIGANAITIGYEHNVEISASGFSKRQFGVVKSFEKFATP